MRLADDERGRVPFALVGALLLVASATVATTVSTRQPVRADHRAELAVDGATAAARTALTDAVAAAARQAARRPVTVPADTPYGRVLNDSTAFRDALRVRVYLAARAALRRATTTVDGVTASVGLPPVTDPGSLRAAKRRVRVRATGNGTPRVRVRISNVSVVVRRDGRVVDRQRYSPSLSVRTPALALHRRTRAFERLLDRGALAGDGLARRLTVRLYPIAWARGYAQYGGAPVANVVANRHVEIATNGALLALQRSALGRSDPTGRAAMLRATARVGATDVGAGLRYGAEQWAASVLADDNDSGRAPGPIPGLASTDGRWADRAADAITVGVNGTADRAFEDLLSGRTGPSLAAVVDDVYEAEARLVARSRRVERETTGSDQPPPGWNLTGESVTTSTRVRTADVSPPRTPAGFHRLASYGRVVVRERRVSRRYRRGDRTRVRTTVTRTVHRVGLAVVGRHASTDLAPARGIATVHEPGGPLDGPNLAGVRERALDRLVAAGGGPDALARAAARDQLDVGAITVDADAPEGIRDWLSRDLAARRERVRALSTSLPRREVATGANPAAALADALLRRRAALVDAPSTYGSVAAKARVAARSAYLDRVQRRLRDRANASRSMRNRLERALGRAGVPTGHLAGLDPFNRPEPGDTDGTVVDVDGAPPYLTLAAVTPTQVPAADGRYHPMVARNLNVFTLPYGDAADVVAGSTDGDRVSLRTAARTLRGVNRTLDEATNETLRHRRDRLRRAVSRSVGLVAARLRSTLAAESRLGAGDRRAAVRAALARWETVHGRAMAAANGSLADAAASEALARAPGTPAPARDRLRVRLRAALDRALRSSAVRPPEAAVRPVAESATRRARGLLAEGLRRQGDRVGQRLRSRIRGPLGAVAAGLPVLPVPSWWYATLNVWHVTVRGEYARFAVGGRGGSPADAPDATVTYVRQADPVALDVDGDGGRERLGRTTPVAFEAETTVFVVVPPGRGVGDLDGNADERSPGWPEPG